MIKCTSTMLAPDSFSGGPRIPCTGIITSEGIEGGCGEPCSFVMDNISNIQDEEQHAPNQSA